MFGKMDTVLASQAVLFAVGLVTVFVMHEGARKLALAIRLSTAVHKDLRELAGGLIGAISTIFWFIVLVGGFFLMVRLFYLFQLDPKSLAGDIVMGTLVSALAIGSGALSGYYTR